MKRIWIIAAAVIIFSSCDDSFFTAPYFPQSNENGNRGTAPSNVTASHGEKDGITVSWDSVSDAEYYYIYKADTPLNPFVLCGETGKNQHTFKVSPGSSVYYSVSSVLRSGTETSRSNYVMGTSLAQPVISDITDISEASATVTWYMENVSGSTYKNDLLYTVYCYNNSTNEVAQIMLNASEISENRAVFYGLNANTKYEYQVEAFLRSNQNASEKSNKVDAATARRYRPGKPEKLKAARGTSADKVELSFELPDFVDIALGDNTFEPKPVYFTISKRIYSESGSNEYKLVCAYFGSNADNARGKTGSMTFSEYIPNKPVTWTDNITPQTRGVTYEYLVQSYVDNTNKIISSDSSCANETGWAISNGEVSYGKPVYSFNSEGTLYSKAELPVSFDFDPKGEEYTYTVSAKVEPIDDTYEHNPSVDYSITSVPLFYDKVRNYKFEMNLAQKSTVTNPGRGIYSVEVAVSLPGGTTPITTFKALGSLQISEDTQPIVVENFRIRDGYKDRFVLIWDNYKNRRYAIEESDDGLNWTHKYFVNDNPDDSDEGIIKNYEYPIDGYTPDTTKYFRIRPARKINASEFKSGQPVYAQNAAQTLGVPKLSVSAGASYSLITPVWTPAQKADTYRIKYKYTDEGSFTTAETIGIGNLTVDATGNYKCSFSPEGFNNVQKAGKEIQIEVEALNEGLRDKVGGGEISTASREIVKTRLVGPAFLDTNVSKAVSAQEIEVSWNSVEGANGYYIFRRQFNMDNTAEQGSEAVVYYVPSSSATVNVIGKNLALDGSARTDATTVKVSASVTNSRYTLRDIYLPDNEYDGAVYSKHTPAYRDQQNDMAQGLTYRYFIVPVINDTLGAVDFVYNKDTFSGKNTTIASYTIQENGANINYFGAASLEKDGFTYGFGQNVTASKGTYSSTGNKTNDKIQIKWKAPPGLTSVTGFKPRYTVYRKKLDSGDWGFAITNIEQASVTSNDISYDDIPPETGVAYEYIVGISNANNTSAVASDPRYSSRFIASCQALDKLKERNSPDMLGYTLSMVRMNKVSRGENAAANAQLGELVSWYHDGISNSYNGKIDWYIDGYEIFVMNRDVSTGWNSIASTSSIQSESEQSIIVTNTNDLLKLVRDYRHYFKVRSFVLNNGEKVYCPDPAYTWSNGAENTYVKWGARQISTIEFAAVSSLSLGSAMYNKNTTAASSTYNNDYGVTLASPDTFAYDRDIRFNNSKPHFLTVNGTLYGHCSAAAVTPHVYGAYCGSGLGGLASSTESKLSTLTITGPSDANGMYSGTVKILLLKSDSGNGPYKVSYNGVNDQGIDSKHYRNCFTFQVSYNKYKSTSGMNWNLSQGWH